MLQTVQKKIKELNMISPGDKILVGVSGGADSICLLLVLGLLSKEMDFSIEAIHVEHGIRGQESLQDAAFVKNVCARMGTACHMVSVDVPAYCKETGMGMEEAARILRYQEFVALAKELDAKVAVAHNMEDNAETILFQMVRGSSLTGLCGMQPVRKDENGVTYIRPLLHVHRKGIESFLASHGMGYRVDSTNAELDYSRNYIRKVVLPELQTVNGKAVEHIHATAGQLSEIRDFLSLEVEKNWDELAVATDEVKLDIPKLSGLHVVLQRELIYKAIAKVSGGKKDITSIYVEDVLSLCKNQSGKKVVLGKGVVARREYDYLCICKDASFAGGDIEDLLSEDAICIVSKDNLEDILQSGKEAEFSFGRNGEKIILSLERKDERSFEIPQKTYTKWFDYDKIREGFCIRKRNSGDYLIQDALGHRKKLKQYFIDEKIPASERNQTWILAQEELVLWVVGGRMSEHVKITEDTKTMIKVTYSGGN